MNVRSLLLAGLISSLAIGAATHASAVPTVVVVSPDNIGLGSFDNRDVSGANAPHGLDSVRFNVGFASDTDPFNGYVDNLQFRAIDAGDPLFAFNPDAAASVPEPATVALFGAGLLALGWLIHRRRKMGKKD